MVYPGREKNYTTDIVKMTMKGDHKKADQILISFNISLNFLQSVPLLAIQETECSYCLALPHTWCTTGLSACSRDFSVTSCPAYPVPHITEEIGISLQSIWNHNTKDWVVPLLDYNACPLWWPPHPHTEWYQNGGERNGRAWPLM